MAVLSQQKDFFVDVFKLTKCYRVIFTCCAINSTSFKSLKESKSSFDGQNRRRCVIKKNDPGA